MSVYLDKGIYKDYRKEIDRIVWGGFKKVKVIYENYFISNEMYETCEFKIVEYKNEHFFFGTSRNGDWCGYKISKEKAEFLLEQNFNYIVNEYAYLSDL